MIGPPEEEQEVVAMFVEMVSKGLIKDIRFFEVSGKQTYDFLMQYSTKVNDLATDWKNTFLKISGVNGETEYYKVPGNEAFVGEAKLKASDLVSDLVNNASPKKDFQIQLGVAWELGELTKSEDKLYRIRKCPADKKIHEMVNYVLERKEDPNDVFIPLIILNEYLSVA